MKCPNCSNEIPDTSTFCPNCGTDLTNPSISTQPQVDLNNPVQQYPSEQKKSTKAIVISLIALVIVAAIAIPSIYFIFKDDTDSPESSSSNSSSDVSNIKDKDTDKSEDTATDKTDDKTDDDTSSSKDTDTSTITSNIPQTSDTDSNTGTSSSYDGIFAKYSIVPDNISFEDLSTKTFAIEMDGIVEKIDIGYKGDVVYYMTYTHYFDMSEYEGEIGDELEAQLKAVYVDFESSDICKVTYSKVDSFFVAKIEISGVEKLENASKLSSLGVTEAGAQFISMKKTEEGLLSSGYVMK